jgi:protein-tyrosine phosphatase
MAEFIMKDMVAREGLSNEIYVESAATSREEIGNDMYPPAKRKLTAEGIPFERRGARQITLSDYDEFDYIILMEEYNISNALRIFREDPEGKLKLLLEFAGKRRDIADPWYTGNFDRTYDDLVEGCSALLLFIKAKL